jgi:aspartate carbamoyltransferase regulatory subunit
VSGSGEALQIMQKRVCLEILLSADKNKKKPKIKILKRSVWEAQAESISFASIKDTV